MASQVVSRIGVGLDVKELTESRCAPRAPGEITGAAECVIFAITIGGMMSMAEFFAADNIISHVICWLFILSMAVLSI